MTVSRSIWLKEEMRWGRQRVRLSAGPADAALAAQLWGKSAHAVVFSGDSVLLMREAGDDWHFPGGRTDTGETLGQALAREMGEEAGATLGPDPHTIYYVAELESMTPEYLGDPTLAEQQIAERRLVPIEDAPGLLRSFNGRLLKEALAWRPHAPV